MSLRHFPFHHQWLAIKPGAFEDESVLTFAVNRDLIRVGDEAFVTDWTILSPTASAGLHSYVVGQESYPRFTYEIEVARRPTFYIWRVMVPLTLLALVAFAVFWFEPAGLQPQISTCMGSLIALVAFNFAIDFSLPKVAYLSPIDKRALIGFVAAAVVEVVFVHLAVTRNRVPLALGIQRVARWVFPIGYALAIAVNLGLAIRA